MPVVTVHVNPAYYFSDDVLQELEVTEDKYRDELLSADQRLVYRLICILPMLVSHSFRSMGVTSIEPKHVMVFTKKFPPLRKNAPDIWINLATGRRDEIGIGHLRIVLGDAVKNWVMNTSKMVHYPQIDVECEFRDWSGMSFGVDLSVTGEW